MVKEYVAMVHGTPPECGDWEDLLFKDSRANKSYVVQRPRRGVKEASLSWQALETVEDARAGTLTLVEVTLHTGRTHQIRVQFSSRGLPLMGDRKYGGRSDLCDVALLSYTLTLPHPTSGKPLTVTAPIPEGYPWKIFSKWPEKSS